MLLFLKLCLDHKTHTHPYCKEKNGKEERINIKYCTLFLFLFLLPLLSFPPLILSSVDFVVCESLIQKVKVQDSAREIYFNQWEKKGKTIDSKRKLRKRMYIESIKNQSKLSLATSIDLNLICYSIVTYHHRTNVRDRYLTLLFH